MMDKQGKRMAPEDIDAVQDTDGDVDPKDGDSIQSGDGFRSKIDRADPYKRRSQRGDSEFRDFQSAARNVVKKETVVNGFGEMKSTKGATSPVLFFSIVALIVLFAGAIFLKNQPEFVPLTTEATQPYQAANAGHDSDCVYEPLTAAEVGVELPEVVAAPMPAPPGIQL
jgi:hypothetical protein